MAEPTQRRDVYTDGDIVLIIGPKNNEIRLRVSSSNLRTASPIFSVMFGSDFSEGQDLGRDGNVKEIKIPDDDPEVMEIICNALHFNNSKIPQPMKAPIILKTAKVIDKYFLHEAMMLFTERWLGVVGVEHGIGYLAQLFKAARLLRQVDAAKKISRAMVLNCVGSYHVALAVGDDAGETMVADNLARKRTEIRNKLLQAITDTIHQGLDGCECVQQFLIGFRDDVRMNNLQPEDASKASLAINFSDFDNIYRPYPSEFDKYCGTEHKGGSSKPHNLMFTLHRKVSYLRQWNGLSEAELQGS